MSPGIPQWGPQLGRDAVHVDGEGDAAVEDEADPQLFHASPLRHALRRRDVPQRRPSPIKCILPVDLLSAIGGRARARVTRTRRCNLWRSLSTDNTYPLQDRKSVV